MKNLKKEGLLKFLHRHYSQRGHPLELVLDEVDLVCRSTTFEILGECARQNLCGLIICGRSALLQMMKFSDGALRRRLHLIRMQSLSDKEARDLIFEPLEDLGITIDSPDEFFATLTRVTGKFPHMLQYYGTRLVERTEETGKSTVCPADLEDIIWDMQTRIFVMAPVKSIRDPTLKKVALILLDGFRSATREHRFRPLAVAMMTRNYGIHLDPEMAEDVCDDLVIENVLAWEDGSYRLTNETLPLYAEATGLLNAVKA